MGDVLYINLDDDDEKKSSRPKKPAAPKPEPGVIKKIEDLQTLVSDFEKAWRDTSRAVDIITTGSNYFPAITAIEKLINLLSDGPHMAFYKKYSYLAVPERMDKYISTDEGPLDYSGRRSLCAFFTRMQDTVSFRGELLELMKELLEALAFPFCAVRYQEQMSYLFTQNNEQQLIDAFKEFDRICRVYEGNTFSYFNIQEATFGISDGQEQILQLMSSDIAGCPSLSLYLASATEIRPDAYNTLSLYDKESKKFHDDYWGDNELMRKYAGRLDKLEDEIRALINKVPYDEGQWNGYFEGFKDFILSTKILFQRGARIIEEFLNKGDKPPYSILYIDSSIKDCVSTHHLTPFGDTRREGTKYVAVFTSMTQRLKQIALDIAKTLKV